METIKKLFEYFIDNHEDLVKKYEGKYIVISQGNEIFPFDSEIEGYQFATKEIGLGNFILQLCTKGEDAYTQHFYSPIAVF